MKLGILAEDMFFVLDTALGKSLSVLTLVTLKSIPIHPSIFFFDQVDCFVLGQGPIAFDAEISPSVAVIHHGLTLSGFRVCQIDYIHFI
jgi:hypothetical protein